MHPNAHTHPSTRKILLVFFPSLSYSYDPLPTCWLKSSANASVDVIVFSICEHVQRMRTRDCMSRVHTGVLRRNVHGTQDTLTRLEPFWNEKGCETKSRSGVLLSHGAGQSFGPGSNGFVSSNPRSRSRAAPMSNKRGKFSSTTWLT